MLSTRPCCERLRMSSRAHRRADGVSDMNTDLTDAEWALASDLFERDGRRGAPARYARRHWVNACCYALRMGCAWRSCATPATAAPELGRTGNSPCGPSSSPKASSSESGAGWWSARMPGTSVLTESRRTTIDQFGPLWHGSGWPKRVSSQLDWLRKSCRLQPLRPGSVKAGCASDAPGSVIPSAATRRSRWTPARRRWSHRGWSWRFAPARGR
jgi:hypothetical protein